MAIFVKEGHTGCKTGTGTLYAWNYMNHSVLIKIKIKYIWQAGPPIQKNQESNK